MTGAPCARSVMAAAAHRNRRLYLIDLVRDDDDVLLMSRNSVNISISFFDGPTFASSTSTADVERVQIKEIPPVQFLQALADLLRHFCEPISRQVEQIEFIINGIHVDLLGKPGRVARARKSFCLVSELMRLDLPTFDRPMSATCGVPSLKSSSVPFTPLMNFAEYVHV